MKETETESNGTFVLDCSGDELYFKQIIQLQQKYGGAVVPLEVVLTELKKSGITPEVFSKLADVRLDFITTLFSVEYDNLEVVFGADPFAYVDTREPGIAEIIHKAFTPEEQTRIMFIAFRLTQSVYDIDTRLRTLISDLRFERGISEKTLAKYSGLQEAAITGMIDPHTNDSLSDDEKYMLYSIAKELEDTFENPLRGLSTR
jgi:hypothetical protein